MGKRIREIRVNAGHTQLEFGIEFGVTSTQVSRWERDIAVPSVRRLREIAEAGGLSVSELLSENGKG